MPNRGIGKIKLMGDPKATKKTTTQQQLKKKNKKKSDDVSTGFIFMCNGRTKPECYRHRVFGLPRSQSEVVKRIKVGTKLFLFDFDAKLLYGVYKATSSGDVDLEPLAFGGKFPAQIRFEILKECLPLHQSAFREAIIDNYEGHKFKQELTIPQVDHLLSLFRPLDSVVPPQHHPVPPEHYHCHNAASSMQHPYAYARGPQLQNACTGPMHQPYYPVPRPTYQ